VPTVPKSTDITVNTFAAPPRGQKTYWEHPLGVRVFSSGTKSYIVIGASGERKTIGRVGVLSLKDARMQALRLKADYQPKKYKAPPVTLSDARTAYLAAIDVRPSTRPSTRRYYETYLAKLPDMPLAEVEHRHIYAILDKAPRGSAALHLRTFSAFFRWCVPRYLKYSPCTGVKVAHKIGERSRVLSDLELGKIWRACDGGTCSKAATETPNLRVVGSIPSPFAIIVQLLMLTGMRRTECSLIEKSWINEKNKTLTIPASVAKNGRQHTIPVSNNSLMLAAGLALATCSHSTKPYTNWSKPKNLLDALSGVTDWVLHTLRHTYRSNLARLRCPPHIAERLVNHISSRTALERIYDHHTHADEMREWQEKYEEWFRTTILTHHV
jgi:integrase